MNNYIRHEAVKRLSIAMLITRPQAEVILDNMAKEVKDEKYPRLPV